MFKIVFWLVRRYVLRTKKEATLIYKLKKNAENLSKMLIYNSFGIFWIISVMNVDLILY